jgi:hypothetical protein
MMPVFPTCWDILPDAQRQFWPELRPMLALGFVLYGGTAIALRQGHRPSVDFDFFTDRPLNRVALYAACPFLARSHVLQDQPETLTVTVPNSDAPETSVKVSFFGAISFGRVGVPALTDDRAVQVASPDDLMATKLKVLLQRVEAKDYRDVVALIHAGVSLATGLAGARALFGDSFQPSESLKALVYFKGGDLESLVTADRATLIRAVEEVRALPPRSIVARNLSAYPATNAFPHP